MFPLRQQDAQAKLSQIELLSPVKESFSRSFSRSEWMARLLGLTLSRETAAAPGLVLIKIDGLSQHEFEPALQRGEMPFLRRLMQVELAYRPQPPRYRGGCFTGKGRGPPIFRRAALQFPRQERD